MPFHRGAARSTAHCGLGCFSLLCNEVARAEKAGARSADRGAPPGPREPTEWRSATRGRARPWARALPGAPRRHHAPRTQGTGGQAGSEPRRGTLPGFRPRSCPAPAPLVLPPSSRPPHPRTACTGHPRVAWDLGTCSQVIALRRRPSLPLCDKAPCSLFICIFRTNV